RAAMRAMTLKSGYHSCRKRSPALPFRHLNFGCILTAETIKLSGIYSGTADQVRGILGFDAGTGMIIPYPGTSPVYFRVKLDVPGESGRKYRSPQKSHNPAGNRLYIPPNLHPNVLGDPGIPLIITEGEKKALAA